MKTTALGIDLAKSILKFHGLDQDGAVLLRKNVRRSALRTTLGPLEPCLTGMVACPTWHF